MNRSQKFLISLSLLFSTNLIATTVKSSHGKRVANAFIVDYHEGRPLYFCIVKHMIRIEGFLKIFLPPEEHLKDAGTHFGRVHIGSGCHYGYGGDEYIERDSYEVILDSENLRMRYLRVGDTYDVLHGTQEGDTEHSPCAGKIAGIWHPGKFIHKSGCFIGYGGTEVVIREFENIRFLTVESDSW